jgi:hypothetical protein
MPQDPGARALLIHAAAYAVVVAVCAAVNLWLNPAKLWFVWVALGWGLAVAAHGLAYWLRHAHRRERVFTDPRARGFAVHLFAYVAVVILLFVVNLTVTPNTWWFYWVALGWGAGVALHGWLALRRRERGDMTERMTSATPLTETARKPQPAIKPERKSSPPKKRTTASKTRSAPRKKPATARKRPPPKR